MVKTHQNSLPAPRAGLEEEFMQKERLFWWGTCGNNPVQSNLCQGPALMSSLSWHMGNSTSASKRAGRTPACCTHGHFLPAEAGNEIQLRTGRGAAQRAQWPGAGIPGTRHFWVVPSSPQHKAPKPVFPPAHIPKDELCSDKATERC